MTPLERKAAYVAASILKQQSLREAAAEIGAHPNHIYMVLTGRREGGRNLEARLASYVGKSLDEWLPEPAVAA